MQLFPTLAAALAASTTVSASATAPATTCATPTATVTEITQHLFCRRFACMKPTRFCSAGEPTQPEPRPPFVLTTVTPEPGACTAVAEALDNPGCNLCPTCLAAVPEPTHAVAEPTHTAALATSTFTA